jgi:DMSO/TMAO reductase YedYZ molybdopterin-dependent catalytic subunit
MVVTVRTPAVVGPRPWQAALIGGVSATTALAAGELAAAVLGAATSPVTAIANRFIDSFAASLKSIAVALFGTNDKLALVVGIVVVAATIAALFGLASRWRRWIGPVGIAFFGALGGWVMATDPQGETGSAFVASVVATVAGVATFVVLWKRTTAEHTPAPELVNAHDRSAQSTSYEDTVPRSESLNRRHLLLVSGGLVAASGAGALLARRIRASDSVSAARAELVIPEPRRRVPLPDSRSTDSSGASSYITRTEDFYRIDTAILTPHVSIDSWSLEIDGLVRRPTRITYDELLAHDSIAVPVTIACVSNEVGGHLVGNAVWQGIPLTDLLDRAGVEAQAEQVVGKSVDGFTAGFPLGVAVDGRDAIVAYAMNNEPLPVEHGYPVRLIVPGLYGYVSATKWLERIELTTWDGFDGYWISRGWSKEGPIKTASRIDLPRNHITAGTSTVAGVAWAPRRGISRVELQIDDGDWAECRLGPVANDDTWVQWWLDWEATPGRHELRVRATDGTGATQTGEQHSPAPDGATGWHTRVVNVS